MKGTRCARVEGFGRLSLLPLLLLLLLLLLLMLTPKISNADAIDGSETPLTATTFLPPPLLLAHNTVVVSRWWR